MLECRGKVSPLALSSVSVPAGGAIRGLLRACTKCRGFQVYHSSDESPTASLYQASNSARQMCLSSLVVNLCVEVAGGEWGAEGNAKNAVEQLSHEGICGQYSVPEIVDGILDALARVFWGARLGCFYWGGWKDGERACGAYLGHGTSG